MAGVLEEEFDEGEVWDVLQDQAASTEAAALITTPPPRNRRGGNGKKAVSKDEGLRAATARMPMSKGRSSAPVAIPSGSSSRRGGGEEEEEDGAEMLPPHEWLARKMERMSTVSAPASPPEACRGRSKGREMRKVRDAVLPKTAFSEQ
ncbi:protein S40-5-like [Phragmites australis]|uniref:protein S40-5-like n=1 Tax=Phragmites australis TaxID=29695 RepID=UPI002D78622F|nr:protein S40-5-like [Phragmites australis]